MKEEKRTVRSSRATRPRDHTSLKRVSIERALWTFSKVSALVHLLDEPKPLPYQPKPSRVSIEWALRTFSKVSALVHLLDELKTFQNLCLKSDRIPSQSVA